MSARMQLSNFTRRFGTSVDTKFHIDYDWWDRSNLNQRLYLFQQLCEDCRKRFKSYEKTEEVDWVDLETGEVRKADALIECLRTTCAHQPDFIDESLPLTTACFRVFLTNQNVPLTPRELSEILGQTAAVSNTKWASQKISRVLSGPQVYLGLRPLQ